MNFFVSFRHRKRPGGKSPVIVDCGLSASQLATAANRIVSTACFVNAGGKFSLEETTAGSCKIHDFWLVNVKNRWELYVICETQIAYTNCHHRFVYLKDDFRSSKLLVGGSFGPPKQIILYDSRYVFLHVCIFLSARCICTTFTSMLGPATRFSVDPSTMGTHVSPIF